MEKKDDIPRLEGEKEIEIDLDFERVNIKKRRYPFFLLALVVIAVISLLFMWKLSKENSKESLDASVNTVESDGEWQGAFSSLETLELCREASVSVIVGGERCSGFVYSSDGWIATAGGIVNENIKGRIEVLLCDGRRFFVDSFRINRESGIALMQIDAEGLSAVELSTEEVISGEEIFTLCDTVGDGECSLFSGRIAHPSRVIEISNCGIERRVSVMQLSILLTEEGVGAPIFNSQGILVGIGCAPRESLQSERYMVGYAFSALDIAGLLENVRKGESGNSDEYLVFIAD